MALLRRKVTIPLPSIADVALPDIDRTRKHLDEVRQWLDVTLRLRNERSDPAAATSLAAASMEGFPTAHAAIADEVRASLEGSLRLGLTFAAMRTPGQAPSPELWDALVWASLLVTPEQPDEFVAAYVYGCMAGHYLGSFGEGARASLVQALEWDRARAVSPRASVVRDAAAASWESLQH